MITNSPFIQLGMVILAVSIFLLYIKPTVADIRATQDQVAIYQSELDRVNEVNNTLQDHINEINLLPLSGVQALERYLPITIDEIAVMRDLLLITKEVDVQVTALDYTGSKSETADSQDSEEGAVVSESGIPTLFSLGVTASYDSFKQLLKALEVNNYRFTVESVEVTPAEDDLLTIQLSLATYALGTPTAAEDTDVATDDPLE